MMSDKMRWRYGDTNAVMALVDSVTVIEIGDLVYQDTDDAKPASDIRLEPRRDFDGYEQLRNMKRRFAEKFLGVAMQRSRSGDTDPIQVATTGVFEFNCRHGSFEMGDFVGVDSSGTALANQQVVAVASFTKQQVVAVAVAVGEYAIGEVAKRVPTAATSVLVDIHSTVAPLPASPVQVRRAALI